MSILLIEEIQEKVIQVANKYYIPRIYLFGYYARNTATEKSDVDLVIDSSHIADYSILYDIEQELEEELKCHVDIIEYEILTNNNTDKRKIFNSNVRKEMIAILWIGLERENGNNW